MQPHRRRPPENQRRGAQGGYRPELVSVPVPRDGLGAGMAACPSGLSTLRGIADLLNSTLAQCHRNGERIAAHAGRSALWETDRILHMLVGHYLP